MSKDEHIKPALKDAMEKEGLNPLNIAFGDAIDLAMKFDDNDIGNEDMEASRIIPGDRTKVSEQERVERHERKLAAGKKSWLEELREAREQAQLAINNDLSA